MFRSLRLRMAASHAAVLTLILVTLGGAAYLALARNLDRSATADLEAAARAQADRIVESGTVLPPPDSDVPSANAVRTVVFGPDGGVVGESQDVPSWIRVYPDAVTDLTVAGERVRVVTLGITGEGRTIATVVAGRSLAPEDRLLDRLRLLLLAGGAVAILVSMGAGWLLAGRAVRPVERAYEAQAGFAADASHELRTPLAFIRSGVEVLGETDPDLGEQVLQEVDYLTGLSQQLLLLARAERGTMDLERGTIELHEVCRRAVVRSETTSGNRLSCDLDEVRALGDRIATEAALDVVLENVSVHGGSEAVVRCGRAGDRSVITVEDHGPGIPDDLRERVFERFTRADPSRTRDTGGAGLGLSVARSLVEAQGGRMWLEATPGGGLTARIALPAA
jgi:signal transduction histidine kinase